MPISSRVAAAGGAIVLLTALVSCSGDDGPDEPSSPPTGAEEQATPTDDPEALPPVEGDPLDGSGDVERTLLTHEELTSPQSPEAPIEEAAFELPDQAAMPEHTFEGTLTLDSGSDDSSSGFELHSGCVPDCGEHLPPFEVDLVQHGSHLVPVEQGLVVTGDDQAAFRTYNLIVGPGRAWSEQGDSGEDGTRSRASIPFALVQRNQNCTHNGVLAFLFDDDSVSQVRFQVTAETCQPGKFDMWGQVDATYEPSPIPGADDIRTAHAAEVAGRMPTEPLSELATDHPDADLDLEAFGAGISPENMTAYGVVVDGVNYVADSDAPNPGCQTRYGAYPYCEQLRLPSYSAAKTVLAGLAVAHLTEAVDGELPGRRLGDLVPEMADHPNWQDSPATVGHAADLATGHYFDPGFQADEDHGNTIAFLETEPYADKMDAALAVPPHAAEAGHTWTYRTSDTFLLVQALTEHLHDEVDPTADVFQTMADEVYSPIGLSAGALSTLRTDNLEEPRDQPTGGRPLGGLGMFLTVDDVAELATLYQAHGAHDGTQLVDRDQVLAAMQRSAGDTGVAAASADGDGTGAGTLAAGGHRYSNGLWAFPTAEHVPGCALRVPFMSGYGGITIAMFPNGSSYYYFSDGGEFSWAGVIAELDRIAPMCAPTTVSLEADGETVAPGDPITLTATVEADTRSWAPTGTVQLRLGDEPLGPWLPLDGEGRATTTVDDLPAGRHELTAVYAPDLTAETDHTTSPALTALTQPCPVDATTCDVESTEGMAVGDTVVMGDPDAGLDSHVVTELTDTTVSWAGAHQRAEHPARAPVWVQNTAGGGFAESTSQALELTVSAG